MCEKTLKNIFSMYFENSNNDFMLEAIAFRAVEEAIQSNLIADMVALCECEVFSEKFRGYLLKGFSRSISLDTPICVDLISNKNVDFESIELSELKKVSEKFTKFKSKFKSNVFRTIDHSLKDYVLEKSFKSNDFEYIKNFIRTNEEYTYLRSKFLTRIKNYLSEEEHKELNFIIQDDMLCETKCVPKRIIEKRETGALKHLI